MSKSDRISHLRAENDLGLDPRYAGWFACFNRGQPYEAHDVLEDLWLGVRGTPVARFYQGLIQLAGAFVHLQKNRLRPADALFRLAENNLRDYLPSHERLDVKAVLERIREWREELATGGFEVNPLQHRVPPVFEPRGPSESV